MIGISIPDLCLASRRCADDAATPPAPVAGNTEAGLWTTAGAPRAGVL
jgi:hypothetical protein